MIYFSNIKKVPPEIPVIKQKKIQKWIIATLKERQNLITVNAP